MQLPEMHEYNVEHSSGIKAEILLEKIGRKSHKMGEYADIFSCQVKITDAPADPNIYALVRCFDERSGYIEYHGEGHISWRPDIFDYGWVGAYKRYMGKQCFHNEYEKRWGDLVIGKSIAIEDEEDVNLLFGTYQTPVPSRTGDQNVYEVKFTLEVFTKLPDGTYLEIGNRVVSDIKEVTVEPGITNTEPLGGLGGPG